MLELASARKNKINLSDYNFRQDMESRMLMADFSVTDLEILEEILFSPLRIATEKLTRSLYAKKGGASSTILNKLVSAGLISIQGEWIFVDKERRKYFESQIIRFDPEFKPDMEFLSTLLKKVPIHCLPSWYALPRTSNNIFESILEKYLLTPSIFTRYLAEASFSDPLVREIARDLFAAPEIRLYSSDVVAKYNLSRAHFEEVLLLMEFYFLGCLSYEREDDHWVEKITPFYEWEQYLRFLKETKAPCLPADAPIVPTAKSPFSFVETMSAFLSSLPVAAASVRAEDSSVLGKLLLTELAHEEKGVVKPSAAAKSWLHRSLEERALYLYRHPKNRILSCNPSEQTYHEKELREAEKSIRRALHGNWVFFEDFLRGTLAPLGEQSSVALKKTGKHWGYCLPSYTDKEKKFLKSVLFEWLFEAGFVATGTCGGRECFAVTPFGRSFFEES